MTISPRLLDLPFETGARVFITDFADDTLAGRIHDSSRDEWSLLSYSQGDYGSLLNTEVVDLAPLTHGPVHFEKDLLDRVHHVNEYLEEAIHAYMPEFGIQMQRDLAIQVYSARGTGVTSAFPARSPKSGINANMCISRNMKLIFPVLNLRLELMFGDILMMPAQFPHFFAIECSSVDPVSFVRKELVG